MNRENILKALQEVRKTEKRKFSQTAELIINLKNFDAKKESINLIVSLPHKVKEKKICGFLTKKTKLVDSITKPEFAFYKGKEAKKLSEKYDTFISVGELMPAVATSFGKILGPSGKMPSPKLGLLMREDEESIRKIIEQMNRAVKIQSKQPSIKVVVGKEDMKDEDIAENVLSVYNAVFEVLPRKKENLRSVLIKFTMSMPAKIEF